MQVTISGKAGSGKTTIARLLAKTLGEHGIQFRLVDDSLGACKAKPLDVCARSIAKYIEEKGDHVVITCVAEGQ